MSRDCVAECGYLRERIEKEKEVGLVSDWTEAHSPLGILLPILNVC